MSLVYESKSTFFHFFTETNKLISLEVGFHDSQLTSWRTDNGDLIHSGAVSAFGCGPLFPDSEACSIGYWDKNTDCLFSGISISIFPTHIIYEFGGTKDFAFIFMKPIGSKLKRQVLIYRPGVGAIYSRVLTDLTSAFITKDEFILQSAEINGKATKFSLDGDIKTANKNIRRIENWIKSLSKNDVIGGLRRIHWGDLEKE